MGFFAFEARGRVVQGFPHAIHVRRYGHRGTKARSSCGDLLLVDELEWIRTDHPDFRTYLGIVETMLADRSATLYIGPALAGLTEAGGLMRRRSRVRRLDVAPRDAATMFYMNMSTWKRRPFIRRNVAPDTLGRLEAGLHAVADGAECNTEIEWGLRQTVFQRV